MTNEYADNGDVIMTIPENQNQVIVLNFQEFSVNEWGYVEILDEGDVFPDTIAYYKYVKIK